MIDNSISVEIPMDSTEVHLSNHCLGVKSEFANENYRHLNLFDTNGFFHSFEHFGIGWKMEIKEERIFGAKRIVILSRKK